MPARREKTHRQVVKGWHPFTDEEIRRYVSAGHWLNLTVCDCLDRNTIRDPHKLAVVDDFTKVTWKELQEKVNRLAIQLLKLGVIYGDFFALQMMNTVEFMYMFFALNRLGAIPIMCVPRHRRLEIEHVVRLHEAKGICVPINKEKFDHVAMVEGIRKDHPYLKMLLSDKEEAPPGWVSICRLLEEPVERSYPANYLDQFKPDPNDICMEQLSGGSTGVPKGMPRTHNDYICGWKYLSIVNGCTDESVCLVSYPVSHNGSIGNPTGSVIFSGGTIILTSSPAPEWTFQLIEKYRVTHLPLIPVQLGYIKTAHEKLSAKYDLSSVKVVMSGGQLVPPEFSRWCVEVFRVGMIPTYGATEGPHITARYDGPKEAAINTIGKPIIMEPELETKIVDDDNKEVKKGDRGEMAMRGPLVIKGYLRDEAENQKNFDAQGFWLSGDIMAVREDGNYTIEGRKKDMIIRGGENIYTAPIEDMLMQHPAVETCVAVGIPDPVVGEKLCMIIEPVHGKKITLEEALDFCKRKGLAVYMLPERVETVNGWPIAGHGKIDKRRLRAYMVARLFKEGKITKELGDEYLKRDKFNLDDVISGKISIEFVPKPA